MKKPLSIFLSILILLYCSPVSALGRNSEAQFNNAVFLLQDNKYTEAAEAFAELGNYPDAPRYAMYCKALAMAEKHQYSTAIKNLKHLTGFLDSDLLVIYFEGLWNENFEDYEGAEKILREISLYRDVEARLAAYPGLINAREYRKADAMEQQGRLEKALSAFEALGSYSDSRERAAAIQEKINMRDYQIADDLEQQGLLEEALSAFEKLGDYSDSRERAAAIPEKINMRDYQIADDLEQQGRLEKALSAFEALGDYSDSKERAAAIPEKINMRDYQIADDLEQQGRLEKALSAFEALGDYSDSRERAAAIPYKILERDSKKAAALEQIVIPSDDDGTEMFFNPDGTYRFWFAPYSIEDLGTWTYENGVLTLTNVKGKISSGESDPIKLHYTYSGSGQLTGDYTIPAITLSALAAEAADRAKVLTHAEYMAAEMDSEVVIESYVQAHQSWWDDKVTVYLQSEDGAYFAYEMACSEEDAAKLVPGQKIRVKGYKTEWAGEVEIASGSTFVFVAGEPWIATAADVTDLLATPELADHMNEFVAVKGATVVAQDNGEAFSYKNPEEKTDDLYFAVEVDGAKYNFCVEYYLYGKDTDVYKAVEGLKVGDVVDIEGFLYWYNGANLQATSINVR